MTTLRSRHSDVAQVWARRYTLASREAVKAGHHMKAIDFDHHADALWAIADGGLTYQATVEELAFEEAYVLEQPARDHDWLRAVRRTREILYALNQEVLNG